MLSAVDVVFNVLASVADMPGSPASSDPLTSPSPSPPPRSHATGSSTKPTSAAARAAGLESGSELSELTEEEDQDQDAVKLTVGSSRRRKRGLVPAPMWDWATKKKKEIVIRPASASKHVDAREPAASAPPSLHQEDDELDHPSPPTTPKASETPLPVDLPESDNEDDEVEADRTPLKPPSLASHAPELPISPPLPTTDDNEEYSLDVIADAALATQRVIPPRPKSESPTPMTATEPIPDTWEDRYEPQDEADAASVASADDSIDLEWATHLEPPRVHPSHDDSSTFDFLPPHLALARTRLLERNALREQGHTIEEPDVDTEMQLVRTLVAAEPPPRHSPVAIDEPMEPAIEDTEADPEAADEEVEIVPTNVSILNIEPEVAVEEDIEVAPEAEIDPEPLEEVDQGQPMDEEEEEDDEDADDTLEADTDLQPPQRAEALDILAGMEVKFAILRERIYLDKMDEIAREEAMIRDDDHPEVLHFMTTLLERKDRKMKLARVRRQYEEDFARKKRKASEDATWTWWRVKKDELRDCMVDEANGKRRRLEREKRSLESRTASEFYRLSVYMTTCP